MTKSTTAPRPEQVARYVLGAGFLVMLALSLPGHMTYDSLAQLREGRLGVHETWGPVVYAGVLGFFDHLAPGAGLYVTASGLLLFGTLIGVTALRPRVTWWGVAVAVLLVLSPALLIYQGVVWKDVLFANCAVAAFALQARIVRDWDVGPRPWLALGALVLLFALAGQVRQNGAAIYLPAAAVMAWAARKDGTRHQLAWSLGGLLAVLACGALMGWLATPPHQAKDRPDPGPRILQQYDIVGAVAQDPSIRLKRIAETSPAAEEAIRTRMTKLYSPERIDYFDAIPGEARVLWRVPKEVMGLQWREIILEHPGAYLSHRWNAFRWVFLTPRIDSCIPIAVGVTAPAALTTELGISPGQDPTDIALANYASWLFDTPVFSHLAYALIAVAAAVVLLLRREPQDVAMAGLMIGALLFTASFFLVSIACDYRYLYFLDLAALAGVFYLALDPPLAQLGLGRRP